MLSPLVETFRPFHDVVLPLVFVGFFIASFIAIFWYRHRYVRETYIVGFFVVLLVISTVSPVALLPFIQWHKFSEPWPQEQVYHEIRVVDTAGNELQYDNRATLAFEGIRMDALKIRMLEEYSDEQNAAIAEYMIDQANTYRAERDVRHAGYWFPAHGITSTWTGEDLDPVDTFVTLRIYEVKVNTSADGTAVTSSSETIVYEYNTSQLDGEMNGAS